MIPFVRYHLPHGRATEEQIERPARIERMAQAIMDKGFHFEAELLRTGHVSLTVSDSEEDYAIVVVPNGPRVPGAVDRLVERVYQQLYPSAPEDRPSENP